MNRRLVLLLLLLLLGAFAFWLWKRDTGSTIAGPLSDFAVADTSRVTRIFIAEPNGRSVDLRRTPQGWTVNEAHPAVQHGVDLLLKAFLRAEVRSPVPRAARENVLRTMAATIRTVEIYTGGSKPEKIWYVGHATPDHFGTYVLLEKPGKGRSSEPYVLAVSGFSGFLTPRFHAVLDDWREKVLFRYPDLSHVAQLTVHHPVEPQGNFTAHYNGGSDIHLTDGAGREVPLDTLAMKDLLLSVRDLHFERFERSLTRAQRDSVQATPPWHLVMVTTRDGRTQQVPFWKKLPERDEKDMEFRPVTVDVNRILARIDDTTLVVVQRQLSDRLTLRLKDLQR
ncbi:MAG: hypothetical protein JNM31_01120 [Flavobacteriales bacterium]|nr:hypothetical protein [Flavobacteriales bacterium]